MGCRKLFLEVFGHDLMFFGIFPHNLSKVVAGFAKTLPLSFRLKPRGLNVKASTQTQPRHWPVGGWVAGCCVSKAQPVGRVVFGHLYFECGLKLIPLPGKLIFSAGYLA